MMDYIAWVGSHLATLGLIVLASMFVGRILLRRFSFQSTSERVVFTTSTGLGAWALLIFALGLMHLLYKEIIWSLTIAGALGAILQLAYAWRGRSQARAAETPRTSARLLAIAIALVAIAYWAMLLWSTQFPPVHWDAISHHLLLPREYLRQHRLVAVMGSPHPVMPTLNHMLFTWAMALKDEVGAQMIEHVFLVLTALGLYAWGKRRRRTGLGIAAAAFWLGNPLVLWLGESAYVDIGLVCFVFVGVYALRIFWYDKERGWWYLGLGLLAMAAGVKLPGLFFVIAGSVLGLWMFARSRIEWKVLAKGWAIAFFILLPWYAFITYYTHNPIWPTFPQYSQGIWGAPYLVSNANAWLRDAAEPRTVQNFLLLSLDWIRFPSRFFAECGLPLFPLIIVWPLAWIVGIWNREVRWWALWALAFTLYWFLFPHLMRYWLAALPLAVLALLESIQWIVERVWKRPAIQTAVWALVALSALFWGGRTLAREFKVKGAPPTQPEQREIFLTHTFGTYRGLKYINQQAGENERVAVINSSYLNYYFKPRPLDLFGLLYAEKIPKFHWPEDKPFVQWLEEENVVWIFVQHSFAPSYLKIPTQNLELDPVWPDFQIVYADTNSWVFRRKPVPPEKF